MTKFQITKVITRQKKPPPILVKFQNGQPDENQIHNLQTSIFKNRQNKTVAVLASNNLVYVGQVEEEKELYNNFLAVKNKKTGTVKLIAVDNVLLKPKSQKKTNDETDLNQTTVVDSTSTRRLNKEFGSKRSKRMTEQWERMRMDVDAVKEQLQETVANIEITETQTEFNATAAEKESLYRPPINREASTVEEVYPLDDIIPRNVLDNFHEEVIDILENGYKKSNFSLFVSECLKTVLQSGSSVKKLSLKVLLYVEYLIQYLIKPGRYIPKKCIICPNYPQINDHIINNFSLSSKQGRTKPLSMKDKAITYILVLSMIALNYELNIEQLALDIKIGLKKLNEICRILAFSSTKEKNCFIIKLPLPAPISVIKKKKK